MFVRKRNRRLRTTVALLCFLCAPAYSTDEAHQFQDQAIQRIDDFIENFLKTGDMKTRLPELQTAETELTRSVQLFVATGDTASASLSVCKMADVERLQARWQKAEQLYNQAYALAKKVSHVGYQSKILLGRARCELNGLDDYGAAAESAQDAVRLSTASGDKKTLCDSLSILAEIQEKRGELTAEAVTAQRELQVATELSDEKARLYAYVDIASGQHMLGDRCNYDSALNSFKSCHSAFEGADESYKRAATLAQKLGYAGLLSYINQELQSNQTSAVLIQQREGMQRRAEEMKVFDPVTPRNVLVTEDFSLGGVEDPNTVALLRQAQANAIQQADAAGLPQNATEAYGKGLLASMEGQDEAALQFYMQAADLLERDRERLQDERGRSAFLSDKVEIYYHALMKQLQFHRYPEAFNLLERSRSRAFADLLGSKPLQFADQHENDLYARCMGIDAKTANRQAQAYRLRTQPASSENTEAIAAAEREISQLEEERRVLLDEIAKSAPRLRNLMVSQPVSLTQLQQSMRQDSYEALYYLVLDANVVVWHISADSVEVKKVFLPHFALAKKVLSLQEMLKDPANKFDEDIARQMFLFLVQPVLPLIHTKRLVIFPQEELNYIPFQVFEDPSSHTYLGERFQISYAPSATVLLRLRQQKNMAGARLVAVADPALPEAGPEVDAVGYLYPAASTVFKDRLLTKSEFTARTSGFDLVHVAVHGTFDANEPLLSFLSLRPDGQDDGKLTAAEMFGLNFQNTRLVVLSACETGRAQTTHSNEIQGMVRSLLYAGANNLVLSSWKVDDASTAVWMQAFYREAQTQPLAEAARRALVAVKATKDHPYYWAPFVVIGK